MNDDPNYAEPTTVTELPADRPISSEMPREILVITAPNSNASELAAATTAKDRWTWLLSASAFLVMLTYLLPFTIEKMTYAFTRGKQRAMYETAGEKLQNVALTDLSRAYQLVANRVEPSVVHINVTSASAEEEALAADLPWQHPATGQGSGVIVDTEGHIVTNAHVVTGASRIEVRLSDRRTFPATIIGIDRLTDMAVLKISASELMAAEWGDSDELEVGALVWAVGSPLGLEQSVTFGILSGKHRSFQPELRTGPPQMLGLANSSPYHDFLQTDAAVNPGNSGGPLVDSRGRVVGINTAIVGETYQGISLAIPSSIARQIYERILRDGRVSRAWLGVQPRDITPDEAAELGLSKPTGALVTQVSPHPDGTPSPAARAGMQVDDLILQWDKQPVTSRTELFSRVAMTETGRPVEVVVLRAGKELTLRVTVVDRPPEITR